MVHRDQGFTVVELLVAVSVIAGVMVFLASAISFTRQYLARSAEAIDAIDEVSILNRLLSEELHNVVADSQIPSIVGTNRELIIRTHAPRTLPFSGVVSLTIRSDDEESGATVSWHADARADEIVTHRLTQPGRHLQFSYFVGKSGWTNSWTDTTHIPKLVRATIQDRGRSATDMVFTVRSVRPAQCATEPAALRICGEPQ